MDPRSFSFFPRRAAWRPTLGAWVEGDGARVRVWAPDLGELAVEADGRTVALERYPDGTHGGFVPGLKPGSLYSYRIGDETFPDPASRRQPEGVHGPSEVVDARRYVWNDAEWNGLRLEELTLYELHVGTFSPEGTFEGATRRLPSLSALGVSAIELMPVAAFPGARNWGYDGVHPFAPAACYGHPDDLRRLVDRAHQLGLGVFLDVVYNHFGPEGNYTGKFSPYYLSDRHENPWGRGLNFDGPHRSMVWQYFIENALHWVHEYRIDGLRLDATHAIIDDTDRPFLCALAHRVRESVRDRPVLVIAEDHRNLAHMIRPEGEGGWGLDGVWADDFHHVVRVALTGEDEGYYRDFRGTAEELAATLNAGWLYTGQTSAHLNEPRGTDPAGIDPSRFVICIQNHDQVGNRAFGDRLNHAVEPAAYRAAAALLLSAPQTPLLFMGQEWAAGSPFAYFTDHPEPLGSMVTEGRRTEFGAFQAFQDPAQRERIPDPQAPETFERSRLDWSEPQREPHAALVRLHQALLRLRRLEPALNRATAGPARAKAIGDRSVLLVRTTRDGPNLALLVHFGGHAEFDLRSFLETSGADHAPLQCVLTTDDPPFRGAAEPGAPVAVDLETGLIRFEHPGAVLVRVWNESFPLP